MNLENVYKIKDNILFKSACESIHFLRKPPAIAVDLEIFNKNKNIVSYVQIYEREKGVYYTARIEDFEKYGFIFDRGYGKQIALLIEYWEKSYIPDIIPQMFKEKEKELKKNQIQLKFV